MTNIYIICATLCIVYICKEPVFVWFKQQKSIQALRRLYIQLKNSQQQNNSSENDLVLRGITRVYLKTVIQFFQRVQLRQEYKNHIEQQFKHIIRELNFIKERDLENGKSSQELVSKIESEINLFYKLYQRCNNHWLLKY